MATLRPLGWAGECQTTEGWGFLAESEQGNHEPLGSGQDAELILSMSHELAPQPVL